MEGMEGISMFSLYRGEFFIFRKNFAQPSIPSIARLLGELFIGFWWGFMAYGG